MTDHYLEASPDTRGGRMRIAGTRITVDDIVLLHRRLGRSVDDIADAYDLSLAAVHAALAYYYDHQADVDQRLDEDLAFAEAGRLQPSLVRARLDALARG